MGFYTVDGTARDRARAALPHAEAMIGRPESVDLEMGTGPRDAEDAEFEKF